MSHPTTTYYSFRYVVVVGAIKTAGTKTGQRRYGLNRRTAFCNTLDSLPPLGYPARMAVIEIDWLTKELTWGLTREVPAFLAKTVRAAGSEAIRGAKTDSSRSIREKKKIRLRRVRKGLPIIFPASTRKDARRFVWKLKYSGEPVPLAEYAPRQTAKGTTIEVNPGQRKLVRHAFIATMASGHKGVFIRTEKSRLPIKELFSTNIAEYFSARSVITPIEEQAKTRFGAAFGRLYFSGFSR